MSAFNKNIRPVLPLGPYACDMRNKRDYRIDYWSGTDNENLYNQLMRKKFSKTPDGGKWWKWYKKPIEYTKNKNGLRLPFAVDEKTNFSGKYVVLGCSFVEGIGVTADMTVSAYMTKKSGVETLNFGTSGCGCDVVFYNALWLSSLRYRPKKIFIVWPQIQRFSFFNIEVNQSDPEETFISAKDNSKVIEPWIANPSHKMYKNYFTQQYLTDPIYQRNQKLIWQKILRNMWGNKLVELDILDVSEYNQTYMEDAHAYVFDREHRKTLSPQELINQYCARDLMYDKFDHTLQFDYQNIPISHWGPRKNEVVANWLLSN